MNTPFTAREQSTAIPIKSIDTSEDIPGWLSETPDGVVDPPVITRIQELPFDKLTWKNFERLCYRLALTIGNVERCRLYGNQGDDQEGIDIFAKTSDSEKYVVYQCKREKDFGPQKIRDAVEEFLAGEWLSKTREFTLCTQESLQVRKRADAFEEMAAKLKKNDVVLAQWDAPQLNTLLKGQPQLVADFFGPAWASAFCGVRPTSSSRRCLDPAVIRQYSDWVLELTSTYDVPGLSVSMSISEAWIELRTMHDGKDRRENRLAFEKALQNYQEWFRLGNDWSLEKFGADDLPTTAGPAVVIGGPGSGKSTLCKRLANQSISQGKLTVRVSLRRVQQFMASGLSFDAAMAKEATDGAGLPDEQGVQLVSSSEMLIADGLDECDPQRSEVAKKVLAWSKSHPHMRILVTTRPVGHHPNLLPNFETFELLPLDESAVATHSLRLFDAALGSSIETTTKWKDFCRKLTADTKGAKSLAARNPLLLGFLVRLAIDGIEIGQDRCQVFSQILQLMAVNPNADGLPHIDPHVATAAIDAMAFQLIRNPVQTTEQLVAAASSECPVLKDPSVLRAAIRFWEASRAIERVSAGHLSAIVFVHPSLGEFTAARHASSFDDESLKAWLCESVRKPMWRQVVLLACQLDERLLARLLEMSDDNDPCSIEVNIAAEAIAESSCILRHANLVADALLARLTSTNPLVSVESALALQPIAKHLNPDSALLDESLLDHEYVWTRLGALSLLIHSESDSVLRHFEYWLQTFSFSAGTFPFNRGRIQTEVLPEESHDLQHSIIKVGLPTLLSARSREDIERYFTESRDFDCLSCSMVQTISSVLARNGFEQLASTISGDDSRSAPNFDNINSDHALVDGLAAACEFEEVDANLDGESKFVWMKSIVGAIEMGKFPARHGAYLRRRIGFEQFVEVLKGIVAAVVPDLGELRHELSLAKGHLAQDGQLYSLYGGIVPKKPDWRLASKAGLDFLLLEQALEHPHGAVSFGAACVLDGGAAGEELEGLLNRVLDVGGHHAVSLAAQLLRRKFSTSYTDRAVAKLRNELRPGFERLVEYVLKSADSELFASLHLDVSRWLMHPDPYFVAHVAEKLKEHHQDNAASLEGEIYRAFEFWTEQGTWCRDHEKPTQAGSCPECNLCLPSPKAELLSLLAGIGYFDCAELFPLLRDQNDNVQRAAKSSILNILRSDPTYVSILIDAVIARSVPVEILKDVSELPDSVLEQNRANFEELLQSNDETLRRWALNSLTGAWMPHTAAVEWAQRFLVSQSPSTVTAATRILRQLNSE